jgi:hypothetical protein
MSENTNTNTNNGGMTTYSKREKTQAEYDKMLFDMMDIIDNYDMNSGDYLTICNNLKDIRSKIMKNEVHIVVERLRRERIMRVLPVGSLEERIMKEVKEKKYECDSCGSMFVSEKNVKNHKRTAKKCSQIVCERIYTSATQLVMEREKPKNDVIDGNRITKKNVMMGNFPRNFTKNLVSIYNKKRHTANDVLGKERRAYMGFCQFMDKSGYKRVKDWSVQHIRKQYERSRTNF